jgi:type IV pilus assembly protein PilE
MMKFFTLFSRKPAATLRRAQGFTLIEMMIVAAVVAILAAIALPSYNSYIIKSEIRTAQSDLLALSLNFENRYQRTLSYPTVTLPLTEEFKGWSPSATNFTYSLTVNTASAYTLKATGINRQSGCSIIISHENERTLSGCKYADGNWL